MIVQQSTHSQILSLRLICIIDNTGMMMFPCSHLFRAVAKIWCENSKFTLAFFKKNSFFSLHQSWAGYWQRCQAEGDLKAGCGASPIVLCYMHVLCAADVDVDGTKFLSIVYKCCCVYTLHALSTKESWTIAFLLGMPSMIVSQKGEKNRKVRKFAKIPFVL